MNAEQIEAARQAWIKPYDVCTRFRWCFDRHRPNDGFPCGVACRLVDLERAVRLEFEIQPEGNFKDKLGRFLFERNMRG